MNKIQSRHQLREKNQFDDDIICSNKEEILSKSLTLQQQLNDFQLTVEEILVGMNESIVDLEERIKKLESSANEVETIDKQLNDLKQQVESGLSLAFSQIHKNNE